MLSRRAASEPGRLRKRLVLEKPSDVADGFGGFLRSWVAGPVIAAEVTPLAAREQAFGEGQASHLTHRIVVRAGFAVAGGDRFRLGARLFEIQAVHDPDEDGRYRVCLAREMAA